MIVKDDEGRDCKKLREARTLWHAFDILFCFTYNVQVEK